MKIGEILEALKQGKILADIGKENAVGKEKLSNALKKAGYKFSRKDGWIFIREGKEPLHQEYTDFIGSSKSVKQVKVKLNVKPNASISASNEIASAIETPVKPLQNKATSKLDSIDMLLLQNQSDSNQRLYRGFYWDKDIIDFLDNVKHGNKSDLMNEIVRTVLRNKGLI